MENIIYDDVFTFVNKTNDYGKFKIINVNREISKANYRKIKFAIERNPLISIITVNENFEIIDGQHRFNVLKELNLPIYYIVLQGYGIKEVMILNATSTIWKTQDYIKSYANQGNENYKKYSEFAENNNDYTESSLNLIIRNAGSPNLSIREKDNRFKITRSPFKDGDFEFQSYKEAQIRADNIRLFKPYFDRYTTKPFVGALIKLFQNPNYNHTTMIHKLSIQPNSLKPCVNVNQYLELLEKIYNYKNKQSVSFKYGIK